MEELLKYLEKISALLDQIEAITVNQSTVLVQLENHLEDEETFLEMISQMVDIKDELITAIEEKERQFQEAYTPYKGQLEGNPRAKELKDRVTAILAKKEAIAEAEKNNMLFMERVNKKRNGRQVISKPAAAVAKAYQDQQKGK